MGPGRVLFQPQSIYSWKTLRNTHKSAGSPCGNRAAGPPQL